MGSKPAGVKKRARAEPAEPRDSSSSSSSVSSGESDAELAQAAASESEASDSEDDEVENALFRPAPKAEESESASSSSDEEEEEVKKPKAAEKSGKKSAKEEDPETARLKEEIGRKTEATVYVEGIPYKADEGDLVSHFSSCGIVKEVRMPRYQDSGKPRGYGHVVFEDSKSIAKALKLDGKYLFGRYLTVRVAETPRLVEMAIKELKSGTKKIVKGCRTVFIKQLPYEVEENTVREALASCGTILSVRLPMWNHTKKLKGFGYVEFSTEEEALAATKRSGMKIGNRMVIISLDVAGGAPKASFRTRDGQFWSKGEEAKKSLAKKMSDKKQRQAGNPAGGHKKRKTE